MPQAFQALVAATQAAAAYIGTAQTAVAAGTATFAQIVTVTAVNVAVAVGTTLLTRPKIPDPEYARTVKRQAIPDRVSGYGLARIGGATMLWETAENDRDMAVNVYAMHDGLIHEWQDIYLNDRTVNVLPSTYVEHDDDLRYSKDDNLVRIETRRGLPVETNYSAITAISPGYWPATARLDGVASLTMIARGTSEHFLRDYPNGLPLPSAVGSLQYCWDPRLGPRGTITDDLDKEASATWVGGSRNPILQLLDYMTNVETGMGLSLDRFLPVIDRWEYAADVCDEAVPLAAGGTVPRYQSGGTYLHSTAPADVQATILATCDGWMAEDENGCFVVEAGEYVEPDVVLTDDHIVSLSRQMFQTDEQAVNEIVASFCDPTKDYTEVETDAWRDAAEIAATDVNRPQRLSLPWVQNNSQARRLAKIALRKSVVPIRGTVTVTLEGLKAWGKRRIRIQAPADSNAMADIVVDCLPLTLNPDFTVTIPFVQCDPTAYDWDAATEEGAGAGDVVIPPVEAVTIPIIDSAEAFEASGSTFRARIYIDNGVAGNLYAVQWRVDGSTSWTRDANQVGEDEGSGVFIETGTIPADVIEFQIAAIVGSGVMSEWSASETVDGTVQTLLVSMDFLTNAYINGVFTANSLPALSGWAYSRAGAAYALNNAGVPISFAANTPRLTDKGLLIEAAATNLTTYSRDFGNAAWSKSGAGTGVAPVVSGSLVAAPDGTTTARSVAFNRGATDTGGNFSLLLKNDTLSVGQTYTRSIWMRSATPANYLFRRVGGGYQVCAVTATWQRFSHTAVASGASDGYQIGLAGGNGVTASGTLEIWQAQTELGSAASTDIETTTASATRAADVATLTIAAGDGTDELTVDYTPSSSVTIARSAFASPTVINFGDTSQPWAGKYITAAEMVTV